MNKQRKVELQYIQEEIEREKELEKGIEMKEESVEIKELGGESYTVTTYTI